VHPNASVDEIYFCCLLSTVPWAIPGILEHEYYWVVFADENTEAYKEDPVPTLLAHGQS
jgi:hypothetical protein